MEDIHDVTNQCTKGWTDHKGHQVERYEETDRIAALQDMRSQSPKLCSEGLNPSRLPINWDRGTSISLAVRIW